jgi:Flp pilus assembly protein TadG
MTVARKDERGQAIVLMVLALVVLLGMAAMVLDVGGWFRDQRRLQGTADAAALAGAQQLPNAPTAAQTMALSYANQNGGDVLAANITVGTLNQPNDIIDVKAQKSSPGFFSSVLGIMNANITASARALVGPPAQAQYVAPMVVYCDHPLIQNCNGNNTPTFGQPTSMNYNKMGAPGAFGMLDLANAKGNTGNSTLASWILNGYPNYLPLGLYDSAPGANFNSANIATALNARIGTELLFPVFKTLNGGGSNAQYDIIAWIGFHLNSWSAQGNNAQLDGYFTQYIAHGILATGGNGGAPSSTWGVKSIQLIK